jgi:hypothetical protein
MYKHTHKHHPDKIDRISKIVNMPHVLRIHLHPDG